MPNRVQKPAELKLLEGNRGHRPIPRVPKSSPLTEHPPDALGAEGRAEWRRLTKEFVAAGVFKKTDRAALLACCLEWERYIDGYKVDGKPPCGCLTNLIQLWSRLGLTPVDRTRLAMGNERAATTEGIEELLTGGSRAGR